jgi:DNA-binding response OmpR family regulator
MVSPAPRVLVVDEGGSDGVIRSIAALLEGAGFSVRVATSGESTGEVVVRYRPDVAVVPPAAVPGRGRRLQRDHGVPVVVVGPEEGRPALRAADVVLDEGARLAARNGVPLDLTRLEFDLLAHFVRNRNQVLTRSGLLASVWRNEPVSPNAIEALVSKLRTKIDALGPRLIHTVRSVGYVLRVPGD